MPITVDEKPDSPVVKEGENTLEVIRTYIVDGTNDPTVAILLGPQKGEPLPVGEITVYVKEKASAVLVIAPEPACTLTVIYRTDSLNTGPGGEQEIENLDFTAGTEHITAVNKDDDQEHYPAGDNAVYQGQSIGVVGKTVEGTDRYVPSAALRITKFHDADEIDADYKALLWELEGKVNNAPFRDWDTGELLFLGATMSREGEGPYRAEYNWLGNKNAVLVLDLLGSGENVHADQEVPKEGWQYVWYEHAEVESAAGGLEGLIRSAHVATIYTAADFTDLKVEP